MTINDALTRLKAIDKEITLLSHTAAVLGWDQETYMPDKAIGERAEQLATLSGIIHEKETSPEIGELLSVLGATKEKPKGDASLSDIDGGLVRAVFRSYSNAVKLPTEFVKRFSELVSRAQQAWQAARKANDFKSFAPLLSDIVTLTKEKADMLGYEDVPYDALIDEYEAEMRTKKVSAVFAELRDGLVPIVKAIADAEQPRNDFLTKAYPVDTQEAFGRAVLADIGWEFDRGRLDISTHPFSTGLGADDVRLTTRYNEHLFQTSLFGIIHEAGHGLYELGFRDEIRGQSIADGTSLGIHESQSRFWENMVGRSRAFWQHYFSKLQSTFPEQLAGIDVDSFYRGVNTVEPSLIRVEADEVTYGLHIILRFEIETALIDGTVSVNDLSELWREKIGALLGVRPETDADGVLQDIHWSMGAIGYFPTYSLGNLYAAQFAHTMDAALPNKDEQVARGEFAPVLGWLREHIHRHGSVYTPGELVERITGEPLSTSYYLDYLKRKYGEIYNITL